jgi:hypothetical protein
VVVERAGTGVRQPDDLDGATLAFQGRQRSFLGVFPDPDDDFRLKELDYLEVVLVADLLQQFGVLEDKRESAYPKNTKRGYLDVTRGQIAAVAFEQGQGAIIIHKRIFEKCIGGAAQLFQQVPEPVPADFRPGTSEPQNGALRTLFLGFTDFLLYLQPVADALYFSERDPSLDHAERAGIHAHEEQFLGAPAVLSHVTLVGLERVLEGVVNVRDGGSELQRLQLLVQLQLDV